ncbi:polyphosphate kinase 1 [bacterium]|nr:polyphosphate kinase 1 [bacterium]
MVGKPRKKPKKLKLTHSYDFTKKDEILNRDTQWLEFNRRVLHEAMDNRTPLLERIRFLGIFTSNLDEFFMKRLSWLTQIAEMDIVRDGTNPKQHLKELKTIIQDLYKKQAECLTNLVPLLQKEGIVIFKWEELSDAQKSFCSDYFRKNIFPVLTPLAVDPGHPFPFISNLSTSLGVTLRHPGQDDNLFSRIKVPKNFPQLIRLNTEDSIHTFHFIRFTDVLMNNLGILFPNMEVLDVMPFRVTRNVDIQWDEEDDTANILELVSEEVRQRKFGEVVRIEFGAHKNDWIIQFLKNELDLTDDIYYEIPGELDYQDLSAISDLAIPHLKYKPWTPLIPQAFADTQTGVFAAIRSGSILVHHPYESFGASVEKFIETAANDPKVLAIKMTLYRTGRESPFIPLLIRAAEMGKQVVCVVELKARFDEERNIYWAQQLENSGVHVVYGIVGLKTHLKTTLVVRQESEGLRSYVHIGTGNYHKVTANLYDDFGFFTCEPTRTEEVVELFHYLTGRSLKKDYQHLLVAPINMREKFLDLIKNETENAKTNKPARIVAKCNSLEDPAIITALYEASKAGVKIDLIVRGFCCLRPGVKGLSDNIRVISVIGRFLEHSRLYYFANGSLNPLEGHFYMGSADWMYRNLNSRVEMCTPLYSAPSREKLWEVLSTLLADERQAWDMQSDGSYIQRKPTDDTKVGTHQLLMDLAKKRAGLGSEKV